MVSGTVFKNYSEGIRIDSETAFATGGVEADAISLGKVTNFNSTWTDGVLRLLGIGEGRNETTYVYGNVDITGSCDWTVLADMATTYGSSMGFMQFAIGKAQGSGTTASPYELVEQDDINYSSPGHLTFAIWAQNEGGDTDDVDLFEGCFANSLALSSSVGTELKSSMEWTAKKVTCNTSITTAYVKPTAAPWMMQQGSLKWGATPSVITGVQSFTITLGNNPFIYRSVGSRFIEQPVYNRRTYDFTIVVKMTSDIATTLRDDLLGQANSFSDGTDPTIRTTSLELNLELVEGAGASGDKKMEIELDNAVIASMSKPVPLDGGIVEVTFTGFAQNALADGDDNVFIRYWTIT
ncbi:MAG: phage tail tube protein [Candidatus Hodarchaeales archaeon]